MGYAKLLEPLFDKHESFYGKAMVVYDDDGTVWLQSYETKVAVIRPNGELEVFDTYSATTLRHIKEFMYQNGFTPLSKSGIEKHYMGGDTA
jgi:hypothetical protein